MTLLAIRRFPDPILTAPTRQVFRFDSQLARLAEQMVAVMRRQPRCVGLAAPQVGSTLRVAVMDASVHPKGAGRSHGLLVLVNPKIDAPHGAVVGREGCLSVPDLTGNVRRAERLHLRALDLRGGLCEWHLEGFEAVVAQHEVDHLDGKLFLDRVENPAVDIFRRKTYL